MAELPPSLENVNSIILKDLQRGDLTVNVSQGYLLVTTDKVRVALNHFKEAIEIRNSWTFPTGTLIGVGGTFLTANFHEFLGISDAFWFAVYGLVFVVCLVWLVVSVIKIFRTYKAGSIDAVIGEIKGDSALKQ